MEEHIIDKNLTQKIMAICSNTAFKVKLKDKQTRKIYTKKGVRQGCPLSTALFNLAFADLEETMEAIREEGIVIGNSEVWTVFYANDIVLLANSETGIKSMIKKLKKNTLRKEPWN